MNKFALTTILLGTIASTAIGCRNASDTIVEMLPGADKRSEPQFADEQARAAASAGKQGPSGIYAVLLTPHLPDGSFNPIPKTIDDPTTDPMELMMDDWRARYRPMIAKARPDDGPKIGISPFLDRTERGVDLDFTAGWRPAEAAALEYWTDAQVEAAISPRHEGLPSIDEQASHTLLADQQWFQRAQEDPAFASARYIMTGFYDAPQVAGPCSLKIELLDRAAPAGSDPAVLWQGNIDDYSQFDRLAAQQRLAMKESVQALVASGAFKQRDRSKVSGLDVDQELSAVSQLLAADDRWAVMDGIDRALWLSLLSGEDSAPLQAAAYGTAALNWTMNVSDRSYGADFDALLLRSWGLNQLARSLAPMALLPRFQEGALRQLMGQVSTEYYDPRAPLRSIAQARPELTVLWNQLAATYLLPLPPGNEDRFPRWQRFYQFYAEYHYHEGPSTQAFNDKLAACCLTRDCFLGALSMATDQGLFDHKLARIHKLAQATLASNLALAIACSPPANRAELAGKCLTAIQTGESIVAKLRGGELQSILRGIAGGAAIDEPRGALYYRIRRAAVSAFDAWEPPASPDHPAYALMSLLSRELRDPARFGTSEAGWTGLEWTPLERMKRAAIDDGEGPAALVNYFDDQLAVYSEAKGAAEAYLAAMPDSPNAVSVMIGLENGKPRVAGAIAHAQSLAPSYESLLPLSFFPIYNLAKVRLQQNDGQAAISFIRAFYRRRPDEVGKDAMIAGLLSSYGFELMAGRFYQRAVERMPNRYDFVVRWANVLEQSGQAPPPGYEAAMAKAFVEVPGNTGIVLPYLSYLTDVKKDFAMARRVADDMAARFPKSASARIYQARVEFKDGKTSKALEILAKSPVDAKSSVGRAADYGFLAQEAILFGDVKLAEKFVKSAAAQDAWQATAMRAMADVAYAQERYDAALSEYKRGAERYGAGSGWIIGQARSLLGLGKTDESIALLEKSIDSLSDSDAWTELVPQLMYEYAAHGDKQKAAALMDRLVREPGRSIQTIRWALDDYEKLDKPAADAIRARLQEICSGPDLGPLPAL